LSPAPGLGNNKTKRISPASMFINPAFAANKDVRIRLGEVIVFLKHRTEDVERKQSVVTVWSHKKRKKVDVFKTASNRVTIVKPYGAYRVDVETEGYPPIRFNVDVDRTISGYNVDAGEKRQEGFLKRVLADNREVVATRDEASDLKAAGIQYMKAREPEHAIEAYRQATHLDPQDAETKSFLGYALLRQKNLPEAAQVLASAHEQHPGNAWIALNLLKVYCSQKASARANQLASSSPLKENVDLMRRDGELRRLCRE